jgi:hypothetical protein
MDFYFTTSARPFPSSEITWTGYLVKFDTVEIKFKIIFWSGSKKVWIKIIIIKSYPWNKINSPRVGDVMPNPTTTSQARLSTSASSQTRSFEREVEIESLAHARLIRQFGLYQISCMMPSLQIVQSSASPLTVLISISGQVLLVGFDILDHTVLHIIKT